jgi:hypothetical protein
MSYYIVNIGLNDLNNIVFHNNHKLKDLVLYNALMNNMKLIVLEILSIFERNFLNHHIIFVVLFLNFAKEIHQYLLKKIITYEKYYSDDTSSFVVVVSYLVHHYSLQKTFFFLTLSKKCTTHFRLNIRIYC